MKTWKFYAAFILVVIGLLLLWFAIVDASSPSPKWPEMRFVYFLFFQLSLGLSLYLWIIERRKIEANRDLSSRLW